MTFEEYIPLAMATAVFKDPFYPYASLMIETAELADLFAKPMLRGDNDGQVDRDKLIKEAGDCFWNLAAICYARKVTPCPVAEVSPPNQMYSVIVELLYFANEIQQYEMFSIKPGRIESVVPRAISEYYDILRHVLSEQGIEVSDVLDANLAKLKSRAERGVLMGSGGER